MNKNIRVFAFPAVGIVLFLIIALFCTACSHTESYQETTMDFYAAHRTELQAAQATLQDFAEANDDSMLIRPVEALGKDYQNEGVCVKRVNELYFISRKGEPPKSTNPFMKAYCRYSVMAFPALPHLGIKHNSALWQHQSLVWRRR